MKGPPPRFMATRRFITPTWTAEMARPKPLRSLKSRRVAMSREDSWRRAASTPSTSADRWRRRSSPEIRMGRGRASGPNGLMERLSARPQELQGAVEHLILARADAGDRGGHADMGLKAHALELAPVRVPDVVPRESHRESSRQGQPGDISVGAGGGRADEDRVGRRLEEEAAVLRLADRALVDEHDRPARVERTRGGREGLLERIARRAREVAACQVDAVPERSPEAS